MMTPSRTRSRQRWARASNLVIRGMRPSGLMGASPSASDLLPLRRVGMTRVELEWLIGDLSHSCVKGKAGSDVEAVADLCDHLEYAQRTGDGDLDILW